MSDTVKISTGLLRQMLAELDRLEASEPVRAAGHRLIQPTPKFTNDGKGHGAGPVPWGAFTAKAAL